MSASVTHLVLLPTYNTGPRLLAVVSEALRHWPAVLVVVDGSTDASERPVIALARTAPALTVLVLPCNSGKGAAVLAGARAATARGFTHALIMDADGQHPAASITEFMHASRRNPAAMILGRPLFPPNIPAARFYGRKLSVWLVHLETLGPAIADPLFGFRVLPLAPLLAVLGPLRGGRRYDFDSESAVRLCWSGVPTLNLSAPVRYFSRAEGGVSHFRYVRDNLTQIWLHLRLLTELLLWRWPAALVVRRRPSLAALLLVLSFASFLPAATPPRLAPDDPAWSDLALGFSTKPDATADFSEQRFFPFRKTPLALTGVSRVSATRGLSLDYLTPEKRTVILDLQGVLVRQPDGDTPAPSDPRALAANRALVHVLRFDLAALATDFELFGERTAPAWTLTLVPRTADLRRTLAEIVVTGEATEVRRIVIRRSAKQSVEITVGPARPTPFTADELKRFFR